MPWWLRWLLIIWFGLSVLAAIVIWSCAKVAAQSDEWMERVARQEWMRRKWREARELEASEDDGPGGEAGD